jgi:hypothetical protein
MRFSSRGEWLGLDIRLRGQGGQVEPEVLDLPPKEYQEKLRRLHGEKVKVIVVKESE